MLVQENSYLWSEDENALINHKDCHIWQKMQKGHIGVTVLHEQVDELEAYELIAKAIQWAISKGIDTPQEIDIKPYHDADYEGYDERYIVTVGGMIEIPEHLSLADAVAAAENELITYQGYRQEDASNMVNAMIQYFL